MAADTRLSTGYSILSRNESKVHAITPTTLLGCPGSHNDIIQLRGVLSIRAQMYRHDNGVMPSAESTAQLLMNTLYSRRFFPYYAFCLLAGIDKDGKGALYSYDALGRTTASRERHGLGWPPDDPAAGQPRGARVPNGPQEGAHHSGDQRDHQGRIRHSGRA
ncbi:hypothetical protein PINS_up004355 [Pythium insidiosum]|nr:hypothetical protein PINS_up004355 [Pythium insidiosum]